ncbi:MAG: MgtC/SapB family protein [Cellvibrionaceae bacterium]
MFDAFSYDQSLSEPMLRLMAAVLVGGAIGMDRAYRGRAAGFRTHILVCLASSLLMILMDLQWVLGDDLRADVIRMDPARMAQGIMTGIGFLGAGVIMQDKQSVRGLTTAASIWITATIGIVLGAGYYFAAIVSTLLTLVTLALFNKLIDILPMRRYAYLTLKFSREEQLSESEVRDLLKQSQITVSSLSYKLEQKGRSLTYQMTVRSTRTESFKEIAELLLESPRVQEFGLRPLGD